MSFEGDESAPREQSFNRFLCRVWMVRGIYAARLVR